MITEQIEPLHNTMVCSESFKDFINLLRVQYKTMKWALDIDRELQLHYDDPICTEIILRLPLVANVSFRAMIKIGQYMPDECTLIKTEGKLNYWRCWWD